MVFPFVMSLHKSNLSMNTSPDQAHFLFTPTLKWEMSVFFITLYKIMFYFFGQ